MLGFKSGEPRSGNRDRVVRWLQLGSTKIARGIRGHCLFQVCPVIVYDYSGIGHHCAVGVIDGTADRAVDGRLRKGKQAEGKANDQERKRMSQNRGLLARLVRHSRVSSGIEPSILAAAP